MKMWIFRQFLSNFYTGWVFHPYLVFDLVLLYEGLCFFEFFYPPGHLRECGKLQTVQKTRPCTAVRDSEDILEQSSCQKYTRCWVFLALCHMLYMCILYLYLYFCICIFVFVFLYVFLFCICIFCICVFDSWE